MRERRRSLSEMRKLLYKHSPVKRVISYKNEDDAVENATKIMKRVFLGNYKAAKDAEFMRKNNIKAILNCTKTKDVNNSFVCKGIEYVRIPVDDSLKEKDINLMFDYLPVAVEFIYKHVVIEKSNILIHCVMGRQRSVCCLAAYLIKYHGMTPRQAGEYIIDKRQEAFHHGYSVNFNETLNRFYKEIKGKNVLERDLLKDRLYE